MAWKNICDCTTSWRPLVLMSLVLVLSCSGLGQVRRDTNDATGKPADEKAVAQSSEKLKDDDSLSSQKQSPSPSPEPSPAKSKKKARGEWVIAPIPISSPAIGAGVIGIVAYVFQLDKNDKVSPPSVIGAAGMRTNNGSRGMGVAGSFHLKEDRFRIMAAGGRFDVNVDLYGIGGAAGSRGIFVPANFSGKALLGEGLVRIHPNQVYLGARFQYRSLSARLNRTAGVPADIIASLPGDLLHATTVSLGPRFEWDTRDNSFYPLKGHRVQFTGQFFGKAIGSKFTYQTYSAAYNKYVGFGPRQVLAYRLMGCAANGRVPIYDLCAYGSNNDLRGYATGQFQDRRMFATQLEYRLKLPWRFGLVGFGGVGGIARTLSEFRSDSLLPAAGAGLRFRVTKTNPINFRIDYGVGRYGNTLSISVGEAF